MAHYYKAKEYVLNQLKEQGKNSSYEITNHVIYTAYYAVKHNLTGEEFEKYLDDVTEKAHKKLYNCGCQIYGLFTPLNAETRIRGYESGGDCVDSAKKAFKNAVKTYYEDLYLYNSDEGDGK